MNVYGNSLGLSMPVLLNATSSMTSRELDKLINEQKQQQSDSITTLRKTKIQGENLNRELRFKVDELKDANMMIEKFR